jgi:hypothetical protein
VPVETGLVALSPALTFEDMWFESASAAEPPVLETETASKAQEAEGLAAVVGTNRSRAWQHLEQRLHAGKFCVCHFENIYR